MAPDLLVRAPPPASPTTRMLLTPALKAHAHSLGFDLIAIVPAGPSPDHDRYVRWLEAGYAGEMGYLARHAGAKADPRALLPDARSIILVGLSYANAVGSDLRSDPSRGQIASYALGDDYHNVMRAMLIELDGWLRVQTDRSAHGRVFVDSTPVLERSWAMRAGLGFIGKNTCLIAPGLGSNLFLGGLLVPETLEYDEPPRMIGDGQWTRDETNPKSKIRNPKSILTCGRCTRCLDVCPTGALVSAHQMDARLCISYLTIELRGEIPIELRPKLGNWVFGCDLCQDVCPWNRRSSHRLGHANEGRWTIDDRRSADPHIQPATFNLQPSSPASSPPHLLASSPPLLDLLALDHAAFAQRFRRSPLLRPKWEGFMRNVCVAAGNWGDPAAVEALTHHLHTSPPLVSQHAAWALAQIRNTSGHKV